MMLKPFRIRNLYGPHHGIVQITAPQYDSTIVSQPDAALTYLDDDDGEVITIGSSFELGQRLDEPVNHAPVGLAALRLDSDTPIHIFDISHSAASLATWREHEAYASKTLKKKPRESSVSSEPPNTPRRQTTDRDLGMWTTDRNGRPVYDRYVEREPEECAYHYETIPQDLPSFQQYSMRDDGPRSPVLNIETASVFSADPQAQSMPHKAFEQAYPYTTVVMKPGDTVDTKKDSTGQIEITPEDSQLTEATASQEDSNPSPVAEEVNTVGLEQIVTSALQGLDSHLGGFADFLQTTSNALRDAAAKTREADTSAVEGVLDGFRGILGEVGKIGRTMLETLDTEATAIAKEIAPLFAEELKKGTGKESPISEQSTEPKSFTEPEQNPKPSLPPSTMEATRPAQPQSLWFTNMDHLPFDDNLKLQRKKEALAALRSRGPLPQTSTAPSTTSIPPNYRLLRDCPVLPGMSQNISSRQDSQPAQPVRNTNPFKTLSLDWEVESKPMATEKGGPLSKEEMPASPPAPKLEVAGDIQPSLPSVMSKSILDLETSDPDFSVRYPPLMSLRRARTIAGLNSHTTSGPQGASTTQTALSRYPSIDQLEKKREKTPLDGFNDLRLPVTGDRADRKPKQPSVEDADDVDLPKKTAGSHRSPDYTKKYVPNHEKSEGKEEKRRSFEHLPIVDTDHVEPTLNGIQRLPGAWPETTNEYQTKEHSPRKESSGAFFERMMRARGHPGPNPTSNTPIDVRPLNTKRQSGYRHVYPPQDLDPLADLSGLRRSQTVTASNPAARLTRPFDPMLPSMTNTSPHRPGMPLFPRESDEVPRRSGTERQHRRRQHWSERFAAANRQPQEPFAWESSTQFPAHPQPSAPHFGPRPMRSVPQFDSHGSFRGWTAPSGPRSSVPNTRSKVDECVMQLRDMGYGTNDPHEASRLNVYAGAASGDVLEALDMIEEDRKGSWEAWLGKKKGHRRSLDDELI